MVGTEMGTAHVCSRKAKTASEKVGTTFQTHYGPVYALQRHPVYPKHFLTIGDWSTKVDLYFLYLDFDDLRYGRHTLLLLLDAKFTS